MFDIFEVGNFFVHLKNRWKKKSWGPPMSLAVLPKLALHDIWRKLLGSCLNQMDMSTSLRSSRHPASLCFGRPFGQSQPWLLSSPPPESCSLHWTRVAAKPRSEPALVRSRPVFALLWSRARPSPSSCRAAPILVSVSSSSCSKLLHSGHHISHTLRFFASRSCCAALEPEPEPGAPPLPSWSASMSRRRASSPAEVRIAAPSAPTIAAWSRASHSFESPPALGHCAKRHHRPAAAAACSLVRAMPRKLWSREPSWDLGC
jgi:hypothetical protein